MQFDHALNLSHMHANRQPQLRIHKCMQIIYFNMGMETRKKKMNNGWITIKIIIIISSWACVGGWSRLRSTIIWRIYALFTVFHMIFIMLLAPTTESTYSERAMPPTALVSDRRVLCNAFPLKGFCAIIAESLGAALPVTTITQFFMPPGAEKPKRKKNNVLWRPFGPSELIFYGNFAQIHFNAADFHPLQSGFNQIKSIEWEKG